MITITKYYNEALHLNHKVFTFPGGEIGVKLDLENYKYLFLPKVASSSQTITARLQSSADIIELLMVTEALRAVDPTPIRLVCPYVPYGRQDRRCVQGEAHSLKVFSQLINSQNYERVTTFDPHSDVTGALLNNCTIVDQKTIIGKFDKLNKFICGAGSNLLFCSPDAGANKKTADLAAHYGHSSFIRADKLRDLATGRIKEIVVVNPKEEVEGRDVLIVDDLCDAGGTFVGLNEALKAKGARSVHLYVTHGLFTKGILPLRHLDYIWTTNAYHPSLTHLVEADGVMPNFVNWLDLDSISFP